LNAAQNYTLNGDHRGESNSVQEPACRSTVETFARTAASFASSNLRSAMDRSGLHGSVSMINRASYTERIPEPRHLPRHVFYKLTIALQLKPAGHPRVGHRQITHEYLCECEESAGNPDVDLVTRIVETDVYLAGLRDQPPMSAHATLDDAAVREITAVHWRSGPVEELTNSHSKITPGSGFGTRTPR